MHLGRGVDIMGVPLYTPKKPASRRDSGWRKRKMLRS